MSQTLKCKNSVQVKHSDIPKYISDRLARQTLHALDRFFAIPGVEEDYQQWLIGYQERRQSPNAT